MNKHEGSSREIRTARRRLARTAGLAGAALLTATMALTPTPAQAFTCYTYSGSCANGSQWGATVCCAVNEMGWASCACSSYSASDGYSGCEVYDGCN